MLATAHLLRPLRTFLAAHGQHPTLVLSINDSYSLLVAASSTRRGLSRLIQRRIAYRFEARQLPLADLVDVVAPADKEWLEVHVPRARVRVLPLARPALALSATRENRTTDVMLFSAPLGLDGVLDLTLPWVKEHRPDLSLAMVGITHSETVRSRIVGLGGEFAGFVDDLDERLADSRVLIAPSQQKSGTSNKAIRAMSLGVAVVGGQCLYGIPGLVDGVHALVCKDFSQMATATQRLLEDADLRRRIAEAGEQLARSLPSPDEVATAYLDGLWPPR